MSTLRLTRLAALARNTPIRTARRCQSYGFTTSASCLANRAIVFSQPGPPSEVLTALSFPALPPPPPNTLNVRFVLSPINPSDVNVVEGSYPSKPDCLSFLSEAGRGSKDEPVFIPGNEGLAEVVDLGDGVTGLKKNDWVILTKQQGGTWTSAKNVAVQDVLRIPREDVGPKLSDVHAATMTVNPPTAYNMLHDFVNLKEDDWVVQNGANSAVGQAVIQIAASEGLKTINLVRDREDIGLLKNQLMELGANHVLTYDQLSDKSVRSQVQKWTGGKDIRLGLNCIGGKETTLMARLLGRDAHLVSYGAMSKQPLSLPTSLLIFKNLTCHGFWQSAWYGQKSREDRRKLVRTLTRLMTDGKLKAPEHEIVVIPSSQTDAEAGEKVRDIILKISEGRYGKKVLLRMEETPE